MLLKNHRWLISRMKPSDPTVEEAVFGKQVQLWLQGDIGSYVLRLAQEQSKAAVEELKAVDPHQPEIIMKIQMRIQVAESIIDWLADAMIRGIQAQKVLRRR